jgi:hypothetical protein
MLQPLIGVVLTALRELRDPWAAKLVPEIESKIAATIART